MRLIDADAIRYDRLLKTGNKEHPLEWAVSQSAINSMPTVPQHVESVGEDGSALKHGHWIRNYNGTYSCSECKSWIPNEQHYYARYCLFCGAKMDEMEDGKID